MKLDFLWPRIRQFRKELLLISGLTLLGSLATLAVPWLAGQFLGGLVEGGRPELGRTLTLLIAALVLLTVLNVAAAILSAGASLRILNRLRKEVYDHVLHMPMAFHDKRSTGDLLALITYEVSNLSSFLASTLANAPSMLLTAAGAVILLFLIDPTMALIVPLLVPVFFIVVKLIGRRLRTIAMMARKAEVNVISTADSDLSMVPAIKAFATEEFHRDRYGRLTGQSRELAFRQAKINSFIGPIVALVAALAAIAVLLLASNSLANSERGAGDLFAFLLYAALLTRPVGQLADMYGRFQIARGTLSRLRAVLEMDTEPGYHTGPPLDRAKGAIALRDVHFSYPGRPKVLEGFDVEIAPGEIVAFTGDNGVGKSTVVKLLLRYYTPDKGTITLDGTDIARIQLQSLRRQFGYVPQRPLLYNGTIADNIVFGQMDKSDPQYHSRLERAIELAQAKDFIAQLPRGLETEIGDDGIRLSGGQGQRVALARALLRDPPIYIFDEATSMYDIDSEAAFVEDCVDALRGRTVILITHRPASLALADRILQVSREGVSEVSG